MILLASRLPPLVRDLTIDYTALSLVVPEKVHFRFKLEGQDKDWREVVNERRVEYSNLPPRNYRFRVMACNNSGVWNEDGASLDFSIAPAYYQTNWFRVLCFGSFPCVALGGLSNACSATAAVRKRSFGMWSKPCRRFVDRLPNGKVDFSNQHWEEYTGLSPRRVLASGWETAVHPDDLNRHIGEVAHLRDDRRALRL